MLSQIFASSLFLIVAIFGATFSSASECGGTLSGDSGSIAYPEASSQDTVQSDELCVWTIQLETKTNVRLNFSHLDFEGGDNVCSQGSIRAYSLTNAVAQGDMESYTICPGTDSFKESRGIYYLSENKLVVIFRTSSNGEQGGSGFSLSWEGIKFISDPVKHESSISNEPTGIIRYPIIGEYQPNTISTWLVSSRDVRDGFSVIVERANVETCPAKRGRMLFDDTVNCFCDALILYQIEANGELKEIKRICGNLEETWNSTTVGSGLLIALYSDALDTAGSGTGFQMIWTPLKVSEKLSTTCSQILDLDTVSIRGRIQYTGAETEDPEVCFWTVRANGAQNLTIDIQSFTPPSDCTSSDELVVHYTTFDRWNDRELTSMVLRSCNQSNIESFTIPAPIAFFSTSSKNSFEITIKQSTERDESYPATSVFTDAIYEEDSGSINYTDYKNYEFSSFLIAPIASSKINNLAYIKLTFSFISLDTYCDDYIEVCVLERNQFVLKKAICQEDLVTEYIGDTVILLLFKSNYDRTEAGFVVNWFTKTPIPSTECGGIIDLSRDLGEIHFTEETVPEFEGQQCVWTIRAPQSEEIMFMVDEISFESCEYTFGLYVTGFSNYSGNHDDSLPVIKKNIGDCENPSNPNSSVSISGPLAFLVFPRVAIGSFKLKIASVVTDISLAEYPYNSNYTDFQFTQPKGSLRYPGPANMPQFDPYLWMSFVINPTKTQDNALTRTVLKFTQLNLGQANSCWSANVMTYEVRNGLLEQYMICNQGQVGTVEIFGDHTIVLLLRTRSVWSVYSNTIRAEWEQF